MARKEPETLPPTALAAAQAHISALQAALPGLLASYFVTGSAALGDFREGRSDLDFVAVTSRRLEEAELKTLITLHRRLQGMKTLAPLDGIYVSPEDFCDSAEARCARFNGGRFLGLKRFNAHSPDAWVLKQYGVRMLGAKPEELPIEPDWNLIRRGMAENLHTYWRRWAESCRRFPSPWAFALYFQPKAVEWGVLGISRLYFSFRESDVTSKAGAGEYAMQHLPEKWHKVLREALSIRGGGYEPQYRSVVRLRNDALEYVEFMIENLTLSLRDTPL